MQILGVYSLIFINYSQEIQQKQLRCALSNKIFSTCLTMYFKEQKCCLLIDLFWQFDRWMDRQIFRETTKEIPVSAAWLVTHSYKSQYIQHKTRCWLYSVVTVSCEQELPGSLSVTVVEINVFCAYLLIARVQLKLAVHKCF